MRLPRTRREREIWEACDALRIELSHIKEVTGDRIMNKLVQLGYKRGCANEIYRYRKTWWDVNNINERVARGIIPETYSEKLEQDPVKQAVNIVKRELNNKYEYQLHSLEKEVRKQKTVIAELRKKLSELLCVD